jgi:hypothetical protein
MEQQIRHNLTQNLIDKMLKDGWHLIYKKKLPASVAFSRNNCEVSDNSSYQYYFEK